MVSARICEWPVHSRMWASAYLLLHSILIISKHDLQILYALRISFSTSTKCLVHNSSFSLLYLQYPILDGFCNLSVKRFSASLNLKLAKKKKLELTIKCFTWTVFSCPILWTRSIAMSLSARYCWSMKDINLGFQLLRSTNNPSRFRNQ